DRKLDLAAGGGLREFLGADQAEIGRLHVARRRQHLLAFRGCAHSVDVARQERDAELPLEPSDALAQPVDRQPELRRRRAEAAVLDHLEECVDVLPAGLRTARAACAHRITPWRITPTPPALHDDPRPVNTELPPAFLLTRLQL